MRTSDTEKRLLDNLAGHCEHRIGTKTSVRPCERLLNSQASSHLFVTMRQCQKLFLKSNSADIFGVDDNEMSVDNR